MPRSKKLDRDLVEKTEWCHLLLQSELKDPFVRWESLETVPKVVADAVGE